MPNAFAESESVVVYPLFVFLVYFKELVLSRLENYLVTFVIHSILEK